MKQKLIFSFAICLCQYFTIAAQQIQLQIGDTVPNIQLAHMINYPTTKALLSDFKNKLLILDFWNIYCAPCITNFPKMEALQKQLGPEVSILLVTKSSQEQIKDLFSRNKTARDCKLPMLIGDSILSSLFAYQSVPAYAWIDKNGILKNFTGNNHFLKAEYIHRFLKGETLKMPVKNEYGNFNSLESLLTEGNGRNLTKADYYSIITHRINFDGQFTSPLFDPQNGKHIGLHIINQSRTNLYLTAYSKSLPTNGFRVYENRIILKVSDSIDYQPYTLHELEDDWKQRNLFCYESRLPAERLNLLRDIMKQDLAIYFGLTAKIVKQKKSCLVLKVLKNLDSIPQSLNPADSLSKFTSNFSSLLLQIEHFTQNMEGLPLILLNETKIPLLSTITIKLSGKFKDLAELRRKLNTYGLDLVSEEKKVPMLELSN